MVMVPNIHQHACRNASSSFLEQMYHTSNKVLTFSCQKTLPALKEKSP